MMSQNAKHCVLTMSEAQFNYNLSKDTIRKTGYKCIDENENKNYQYEETYNTNHHAPCICKG
jgi:hypothetical protein